MSAVDRYTDLQEVLERMCEEFAREAVVEIHYIQMSRPGTDHPFHDFITCSGIVSEWPEGIYCEEDTNAFFYHGELPPAWGAAKTTFPVEGDLLTLLPERVKDALIRVVQTGNPESYPFHHQELLADAPGGIEPIS